MKKKIVTTLQRVFKKPLYRLFIFLLGIPTFVVTFFVYLQKKGSHDKNNEAGRMREQILQELESSGEKETLYKETKLFVENKRRFFHKEHGDLEKEVQAQFQQELNRIVEKRLQANPEYQEKYKPVSFMETMQELLENNTFLIFSIITSLPMYLLMLIYSNAYAKYILERLAMMVFVLFGVVFLVFTILYMSPMDPAVNILGQTATAEQIEDFNHVYGLDEPYIVQLLGSFKGLATMDMGRSYQGNEIVIEAIGRRFPVTLQVTFASLVIALIIAIPSGIISAVKPYSTFDYVFMLLALLGLSIPTFWLGLVLILNFSINLGWLPSTYSATDLRTLIMPATVLGASLAASVARMTRSSMLEVIRQDYVRTARAKGQVEWKVIIFHTLRNALIPILTIIGSQACGYIGGTVLIESVFGLPGIGNYILDSVNNLDYPVVTSGVIFICFWCVLINFIVDLLYAFIDPRIKITYGFKEKKKKKKAPAAQGGNA